MCVYVCVIVCGVKNIHAGMSTNDQNWRVPPKPTPNDHDPSFSIKN